MLEPTRSASTHRRSALPAAMAAVLVAATLVLASAAPSAAQSGGGNLCDPRVLRVPPQAVLTTLVGDAFVRDGAIVLTRDATDRAGAAWTGSQIDVTNGFTATFRFSIPHDGADGLAFVVQAASGTAIGDAGGGIGYQGIPKSVAVEFDTWQNAPQDFPSGRGDPNANHVSVQTRGLRPNSADPVHSRVTRTDIPFLSDGTSHRVVVDYQGTRFRVFLDGGPRTIIDWQVDLSARIGGPTAWVGLTAATGAGSEEHIVHSFALCG